MGATRPNHRTPKTTTNVIGWMKRMKPFKFIEYMRAMPAFNKEAFISKYRVEKFTLRWGPYLPKCITKGRGSKCLNV